MNEVETAWLAGILEGEGSFLLRNERSPKISCTMTDLDIIERLQEITNLGKIYSVSRQMSHHKPAWTWVVHGVSAANLMIQLLPLMGKRRSEDIKHVLTTFEEHNDRQVNQITQREKFIKEVRQLYATTQHTERSLAKMYGVSHVTVHYWLKGKIKA